MLGDGDKGCRLGALVLAPRGQFPELIPEEHAEDGVGAQAQVGWAQTLVEGQGALLPPDLHQAVGEATVQLALGTEAGWGSLQGSWGFGWYKWACVCVEGPLPYISRETVPKLATYIKVTP